MTTVLAVDPGTIRCGFSLWEDTAFRRCGLLTAKGNVLNRSSDILTLLQAIAAEERVDTLVTERLHKTSEWSAALYAFIGGLRHWAKQDGIAFYQYAPSQWRRAIVGNGRASKEETLGILRLRYHALDPMRDAYPDVLEAVAIGEHHVLRQARPELVAWEEAQRARR